MAAFDQDASDRYNGHRSRPTCFVIEHHDSDAPALVAIFPIAAIEPARAWIGKGYRKQHVGLQRAEQLCDHLKSLGFEEFTFNAVDD